MRTWGRTFNEDGTYQWVEVSTDPVTGDDSEVWITTLIQVLYLNLNESPFYANFGIPAEQSVQQQVAPDFYVFQTQRQFAAYFASLIVTRLLVPAGDPLKYKIDAITLLGAKVAGPIPF